MGYGISTRYFLHEHSLGGAAPGRNPDARRSVIGQALASGIDASHLPHLDGRLLTTAAAGIAVCTDASDLVFETPGVVSGTRSIADIPSSMQYDAAIPDSKVGWQQQHRPLYEALAFRERPHGLAGLAAPGLGTF